MLAAIRVKSPFSQSALFGLVVVVIAFSPIGWWCRASTLGGAEGIDRQASLPPGLEAAGHIGCIDAEPPYGRGSEARLVALVADQDHQSIAARETGIAVLRSGVEPPFQLVACDESGIRNEPVSGALGLRP